jgi:GxxExxY protein
VSPASRPLLVPSRAGLSRELLEDRACAETLDAAYRVHEALGAWHLASTYLEALAVELQFRGLHAHRAASMSVVYRGRVVGSLEADLLVEDRVLVLVRADPALQRTDQFDALRGLAASGIRVGLAFNFGLPDLVFSRVC